MASAVKNHVFQGLLASGSVDAYLGSKCTIPDIYTCDGAGLVVIHSLRTALGLFKEERKKEKQFAWAAIKRITTKPAPSHVYISGIVHLLPR